jgi:hypothetical protein
LLPEIGAGAPIFGGGFPKPASTDGVQSRTSTGRLFLSYKSIVGPVGV